MDTSAHFKPKNISYKSSNDIKTYIPDFIGEKENSSSDKYSDKEEYTSNKKTLSPTVYDVAKYILSHLEGKSCSTMKLHKLLYYSQAWSLVWTEKPLFDSPIEAWVNGPVIKDFFFFHKGMFNLSYSDLSLGNESTLNKEQRETIDSVIEYYGNKSAQWLIDLTHLETPWRNARKGLAPTERGSKVIALDDIASYYSSLS